MSTTNRNDVILCISDMHVPYHHPDTFEFLRDIKAAYKPTRVVCLGDEVDHHAMSFHDSDPDLPSAGHELQKSIDYLRCLYDMFPVMDLVDSNHGSMMYRKGKHHGIPRKYLRSYNEILDAPKGWQWHNNLLLKLPTKQECFFTHGVRKDGLKLAQQMGMPVVQGHYHTEFGIKYASSPNQLYWSMQVGCSIDDKALAFEYNKTTSIRPIIGHGLILDGVPHMLPMLLTKAGRWNGYLP